MDPHWKRVLVGHSDGSLILYDLETMKTHQDRLKNILGKKLHKPAHQALPLVGAANHKQYDDEEAIRMNIF